MERMDGWMMTTIRLFYPEGERVGEEPEFVLSIFTITTLDRRTDGRSSVFGFASGFPILSTAATETMRSGSSQNLIKSTMMREYILMTDVANPGKSQGQ